MAHKTLIDGTSYSIVGGTTLVDGTGCKIVSGRTLIDGTGYDISLKPKQLMTASIVADTVPTRTSGLDMTGGLSYTVITLGTLGLTSWNQVESMKITLYQTGYAWVSGAYGGSGSSKYDISGPKTFYVSLNNRYGRKIGFYTDESYETVLEQPVYTFSVTARVASGGSQTARMHISLHSPNYYQDKVGFALYGTNSYSRTQTKVAYYSIEYTYWE